MARIGRTRRIERPVGEIWKVVADPRTLPEWWPGVERVEGVSRHKFTEVLRSSRGATIRADFMRAAQDEPRMLRWDQRLEGTPFASVFDERSVVIELRADGAGATSVTVTVEQRLRGAARFSPQLNRGGVRRQLDSALGRLAAIAGS
jgi:uncharacterized protein YndB with AHSA1/START domain